MRKQAVRIKVLHLRTADSWPQGEQSLGVAGSNPAVSNPVYLRVESTAYVVVPASMSFRAFSNALRGIIGAPARSSLRCSVRTRKVSVRSRSVWSSRKTSMLLKNLARFLIANDWSAARWCRSASSEGFRNVSTAVRTPAITDVTMMTSGAASLSAAVAVTADATVAIIPSQRCPDRHREAAL